MLAKSLKNIRHIMMAYTGKSERVLSGGETASAKRTQRSMQAAGSYADSQKLIQPRQRYDADGDVLNVTEASTEGAQLICSGRSAGVQKTVACMQGSALELGRPDCFLFGGSVSTTNGRDGR